jgi:adenylosuccinate lyase
MSEFEGYQSPFSWRYASPEMRRIWSEVNKRRAWRQIWVELAKVQVDYGLVTPEQAADLEAHAAQVDIPRTLEIEAEIRHDLMAEVMAFAEQCPLGGGIIHLGATSMDVEDNADVLRMRQALHLLLERLRKLLRALAERIEETADLPVMAFTHLQPAEPTTLGYRLALFAQDLLEDWQALQEMTTTLRGKGFKGAVGTAASYAELVGMEHVEEFEEKLSRALELPFFTAASQTYPRRQDYQVVSALASLGCALYKFAFDLRLLQSPPLGELSEPFGKHQVGSSAMPFKRNPINAEKIDSLGRALAAMPQVAWQNASHSLLERTLDDSANRRTLLPEAFLTAEEMLLSMTRILEGLQVNRAAIRRNLAIYAPFACTERVLMAAVKAGADRQEMHARLREHALAAWAAVQEGKPNPLLDLLLTDDAITSRVPPAELHGLMQVEGYVGIAPSRARRVAVEIKTLTG